MKYIISRYNHDIDWIANYTNDYVLYDRSSRPLSNSIVVPNIGSNISDFFKFIIDNYDNLPNVAVFCKANLFKYITKEEFDKVKDNKIFTPLLTQHHKEKEGICWYDKGIYCEINNLWYLGSHKCKSSNSMWEIIDLLGLKGKPYLEFAPGSNYILPKENILKHSKEFYIKLKSYLDWDVYPGEAQICERGLWYLWR